jgi:antitoxin MazE
VWFTLKRWAAAEYWERITTTSLLVLDIEQVESLAPFKGIYAVSVRCILCIYIETEDVFMPVAKIVKWGNSLAVRIPKPVAEEAGVRESDPIVIEATEGQINLRRKQRVPTLRELVAQITQQNRYDEVPAGPERGKERTEW